MENFEEEKIKENHEFICNLIREKLQDKITFKDYKVIDMHLKDLRNDIKRIIE